MFLLYLQITVLLCSVASASNSSLLSYRVPFPRELKKALGYQEDALLNFTEIATRHGYLAEEHQVTTEDGYILTIFRMRGTNCTTLEKIPVLVEHGMFLSATAFLVAGEEAGLAYLLSDSCYDAWFGNVRGTVFGRAHATLNPDKDAEFWKYSVDEMGLYDNPAMIDYILNTTNSKKINYFGYSQGGGNILITLSERPEYNEKINLAMAYGPVTRMIRCQSIFLRLVVKIVTLGQSLLSKIGIQEVFFIGSITQTLFDFICHDSTFTYGICGFAVTLLDNPASVTHKTISLAFAHTFAGVSVQQLTKYQQAFDTDNFTRYDYGATENLRRYGAASPPNIKLNNIKVPIVLFKGKKDAIVHPDDIVWAAERLPTLLELYTVDDPLWNHGDVYLSKNIATLLYPKIQDYLQKYL